jgi:probable HAF family extracellular repeat protein
MKRLGFLLVMVLYLGSAAHAAPQTFYRLITLQPLSGYTDSAALAVNNRNEVVGYSKKNDGSTRPTYWDPNKNYAPQDIGSFGGIWGRANGINDGSYVVGTSSTPGGSDRAFLWDPTTGILRQLNPDTAGNAKSINTHGLAAGDENGRACIFQLGKPPVDLSGGYVTDALGINDSDLVVGYELSSRTNDHLHAGIWDNRTWQDLTPGVTHDSVASAVNNNGEVTGFYYSPTGSDFRAFIWDKFKGMREIGTLGGATSFGNGINSKGEVVGEAALLNGTRRAFIWREGQGIWNLQSLVKLGVLFDVNIALSINDQGAIVGSGRDFTYATKAFLLLPIKSISSVLSLLLLY